VICRRFSGELIEADLAPQQSLLLDGRSSVNRRNELRWQVRLTPGKEAGIQYRYSVLILM